MSAKPFMIYIARLAGPALLLAGDTSEGKRPFTFGKDWMGQCTLQEAEAQCVSGTPTGQGQDGEAAAA